LYFDSAGVRLRYTVTGDGPPVLLVHGFAVNIEFNWLGVIEDLARDYRVVAFDCRGHGKSGKPHDPGQYGRQMVDDAVRLLDHLAIERAHVVGYSMGSLIAGRVAAYHPDRVASLVLGGGGVKLAGRVGGMPEELARSLEATGSFEPLIRALHPPERPAPTAVQIAATNAFLSAFNDPRALAAVVRSFGVVQEETPATFAPLGRLPVLSVIGDEDPLGESLPSTRRLVPGLREASIPQADHMTLLTDPRFVGEIRAFLAEQPDPRGGVAADRASSGPLEAADGLLEEAAAGAAR
jgi:pimeloyl-ACP methyl ester carboxylesterase